VKRWIWHKLMLLSRRLFGMGRINQYCFDRWISMYRDSERLAREE
jgi:hypothetical protein